MRAARRVFDLSMAAVAGLVSAPLAAVIAGAVKLESPGPVVHRAQRIGMDGQPFTLLKFRTMFDDQTGVRLTRAGDPRITRLGRVLRASKLDELPQLLNVLRGEMSLVGPRPEDPRYVDLYTPEQRVILSVRPGIVSLATIKYYREESMLAKFGSAWEKAYVDRVMPEKIMIDLAYERRRTLGSDLLVLGSALSLVLGAHRGNCLSSVGGRGSSGRR
jgi:lipopolysaccharide/colanic/teichoic acid biosynthesis glycosyltransferase